MTYILQSINLCRLILFVVKSVNFHVDISIMTKNFLKFCRDEFIASRVKKKEGRVNVRTLGQKGLNYHGDKLLIKELFSIISRPYD